MITKSRWNAFAKAKAAFGDPMTWTRPQYLAYGLIRGVDYSRMEKCANNRPDPYDIARELLRLEAWPVYPTELTLGERVSDFFSRIRSGKTPNRDRRQKHDQVQALIRGAFEVDDLVEWVPKTPRKRPRPTPVAQGDAL